MKQIYFCLAVYNEEKYLENCIRAINEAAKKIPNPVKTLICLNGCTDNSFSVAEKCKSIFPNLNIILIKSKKGKLNAQEKMVSLVPSNSPLFFVDSDTEISPDSAKILLEELDKHKELLVVGAFPVAKKYSGHNPWKIFLDNILNIRSRHPMAEISKLDVSEYHKLAITDPQIINTNKDHELKSKIFFHGRLFLLRSKKYWSKPQKNKGVAGDDTYLTDYLIFHYGKNRVRIRYNAIVYFEPFISLREHYRSYKRIYFDLKNLKDSFPLFKETRDHSVLILDKNYIKKQPLLERIKFGLYAFMRKMEKFFYSFSFERDPNSIWTKKV